MRAGIVIPYRLNSELRQRAFDLVSNFYAAEFPELPVVVADDGNMQPFSRAAAINWGVLALEPLADTLLITDADSLVEPKQIKTALDWAWSQPGLVWAYRRYVRLGPDGQVIWTMQDAPSLGCMAIRRDCFDLVGGFDASYRGWGYEDLDFARRCGEHWSHCRVAGQLVHLWHGERRGDDSPLDADAAFVRANWRRYSESVA